MEVENPRDNDIAVQPLLESASDLPMVAQDIVIDNVVSSVDFLTVTVTSPGKSILLMQEAERLKVDLEGCGWAVKKRGMKGYSGYSVAWMAWGGGPHRVLLMLS